MEPNYRIKAYLEGLTREQWRNIRREGIGGSDTPALFGLHRFATKESVIKDKLTFEADKQTAATKRGHDREPIILGYVGQLWDVTISLPTAMFQHATVDYALCNLDGWAESKSNRTKCKGVGIVEAKSTTDTEVAKVWRERVPSDVVLQCQHNMWVTGTPYALAACEFKNGEDRHVFSYYLARDEEIISMIGQSVASVWEEIQELRKQTENLVVTREVA